jgi:hypothetical protein
MRAGSFGLLNPSVRLDYRFSRRVTATASVEYTYANGRYKFRYHKMFSDGTTAWDTTAVRRNGMVHALRAEATVFGTLDRGRWNLKAYYYDSSRGIPGAIVNNVWKNSQKQWDRNFFLQGGVQHASASGAYEWMVNAKYARDHMRYLNPDTTLMYLDNSFNQQELYLSTTHRFRIVEGWDVSAAVDYQYNTLDASLANFSRPNRNTLLAALATAAHWRGLKAQASFLLTEVADKSKTYSGDTYLGRRTNNFHRLTPAIFLGWTPFEGGANDLALRAFYKRIFRMPTFNDLYYTDIGNADLKPEYATQYDFGATYTARFAGDLAPQLRVGADLYYNNIDDKIIAVPKGTGQYRWMMMNIGEVHTLGLDLNASLTLSLPADILLNTRLTYSYQRARDFSDPTDNLDEAGTYKGQIAYIPLHSGSAIVEGQWRGFTLNYSFIYVGERYHNSSNILANYEQPWYTHDIAAHYAFPLGKVNARVSVEVNNLLNQQYEIIQNYPMPGRNFKFIFRVDL